MNYELRFNLYGEWHIARFPSDRRRERFILSVREHADDFVPVDGIHGRAVYIRPSSVCAYQVLTP